MDLKSPIADDGHILSGDPLLRFFKMRKWYLIVSLILLAYGNGWVDHEKLFEGLRLSGVSSKTVLNAATLIAAYFLFQGSLLFWQVFVFYPESIRSRAALINAKHIDRLQNTIQKLQDKKPVSAGPLLHSYPVDDEIEKLSEQLKAVSKSRPVSKMITYATEFILDALRILPTPVFLFVMLLKFGTL